MSDGYQALTAKEKEALRLLLNGHDAKSMARLLGLSVHTVNERLRDARRKLGVTSSREAARLLREREGQTPELLGDKTFGDAAPGGLAQVFHQPVQGSGSRRRAGWIVGGIAMTLGLALLAYILFGDQFQTFKREANRKADDAFAWCRSSRYQGSTSATGNVAFDDWRKAELDRIEEQRRKLDEMREVMAKAEVAHRQRSERPPTRRVQSASAASSLARCSRVRSPISCDSRSTSMRRVSR